METIIKSSHNNAIIETCYSREEKCFYTIYTINEKKTTLDKFTDINELIATHDFWAKITGIIIQPVRRSELQDNIKWALEMHQKGILSA